MVDHLGIQFKADSKVKRKLFRNINTRVTYSVYAKSS